jgi:hypothetical protein
MSRPDFRQAARSIHALRAVGNQAPAEHPLGDQRLDRMNDLKTVAPILKATGKPFDQSMAQLAPLWESPTIQNVQKTL